jgi:hypothetical protein
MDPHMKMAIYVGYHSPSIIKYLQPLTRDLFTAMYAECIFNEDHFPVLGENFRIIQNVKDRRRRSEGDE